MKASFLIFYMVGQISATINAADSALGRSDHSHLDGSGVGASSHGVTVGIPALSVHSTSSQQVVCSINFH